MEIYDRDISCPCNIVTDMMRSENWTIRLSKSTVNAYMMIPFVALSATRPEVTYFAISN